MSSPVPPERVLAQSAVEHVLAGAAGERVGSRGASDLLHGDVAHGDRERFFRGDAAIVGDAHADRVGGSRLVIEQGAVGDEDVVAGKSKASAGIVEQIEAQATTVVGIGIDSRQRADDGVGAGVFLHPFLAQG